MPELPELARDGPSYDSRPENPDAHAMMLALEGSPAPFEVDPNEEGAMPRVYSIRRPAL